MPSGKIFLADDDEGFIETLSEILQEDGYEVCSVGETSGAIEMIQRVRPQVILLDLNLPRGGGLQVLKDLKSSSETAAIPVIMLSGNASSSAEAVEAKALGAQHFMSKPFPIPELLGLIKKYS